MPINWNEKLKKYEKNILIDLNLDRIKREDKIPFDCLMKNCKEKHKKTARIIIEGSGLFCEECTKKNKVIKINKKKNIPNWTIKLPMIAINDGAEILSDLKRLSEDNSGYINKNEDIDFVCFCKNEDRRNIKKIEKTGFFCEKCIEKNRSNKISVSHSNKTLGEKEKTQKLKEETWLKNLGFKNPSQSLKIQKKKEDTCIKNHGKNLRRLFIYNSRKFSF